MKGTLFALLISLGFKVSASCLQDVSGSFNNLDTENVTSLALRTKNVFEEGTYVQTIRTRLGIDTHIQGIIRVPGTTSFILSGGDKYIKKGSLFFADFQSQNPQGKLTPNFISNIMANPTDDKFVSKIDVSNETHWHAGAIGLMERILAVPVEDKKLQSSKILFYDVTDPKDIKKLDVEIRRENSMTGSVLIFRNKNQKIVVGGSVRGRMEFYESATSEISDGFLPESRIIETDASGEGTHIVRQCDGKLFIMDFHNDSKLTPMIWGKNFARLFTFDDADFSVSLLSKRFFNTRRSCNFKAAGSPFITPQGELVIYGSSFFRKLGGERFKMCQFSEKHITQE